MEAALLILVGLAVIVVCAVIAVHNKLVVKKNRLDQAFSSIDVMLKSRYDLVPNLVATVERYMQHESETLTRIAQLRSQAGDSRVPVDKRVSADMEMGRLLGGLRLQIERYPELRGDAHCTKLYDSLEMLEGQIASSRRTYNAAVTDYNNAIEMFPGSMVAARLNYRRREVLTIPAEERKNPSVQTLFDETRRS